MIAPSKVGPVWGCTSHKVKYSGPTILFFYYSFDMYFEQYCHYDEIKGWKNKRRWLLPSSIDNVLNSWKVDILKVVRALNIWKLHKDWISYKCKCPKHREKTPSFSIYTLTNTFFVIDVEFDEESLI